MQQAHRSCKISASLWRTPAPPVSAVRKRGFCAFGWHPAMNISQNKPVCRSHTGSFFVKNLWSPFHQADVCLGVTPASNWVQWYDSFHLTFLSPALDPWWRFASFQMLDVSVTKSLSLFHLSYKMCSTPAVLPLGPDLVKCVCQEKAF